MELCELQEHLDAALIDMHCCRTWLLSTLKVLWERFKQWARDADKDDQRSVSCDRAHMKALYYVYREDV